MIPKKIIVNRFLLNENGLPSKAVQIFDDHLQVHPDSKDKALEGLVSMFGDVFEVVEEYDAINTD